MPGQSQAGPYQFPHLILIGILLNKSFEMRLDILGPGLIPPRATKNSPNIRVGP
jgi:hypothetical protein